MCGLLGILFCVGGRGTSGTPFKTIECYDARQDRWVQVVEMSTRRRHVGVVAVAGLSVCLPVGLSVALSLSLSLCVCVIPGLGGQVTGTVTQETPQALCVG